MKDCHSRLWLFVFTITGLILVAILFSRFFLDEQLRRLIEDNLNKSLKGYTATLGELDFNPLGFSIDFVDFRIQQNDIPEPAVAHIERLKASVHWQALLRGRLVADFIIDRPKLHINLKQAKKEIEDETPVDERGWQDAVQELYPLEVHEFRVHDADITYVDKGPFKPIRLSRVNLVAKNIQNKSEADRYPSPVRLEGRVFDSGKITIEGEANFLAQPHPAIRANVSLENVELDYLKPIMSRYQFFLEKGVLSTRGLIEYAPKTKMVNLQDLTFQGVQMDYIHPSQSDPKKKPAGAAGETKKDGNDPELVVQVDQVNVLNSTVGFANEAAQPDYRLFLSETQLKIKNLSNKDVHGAAEGTLEGKFMGSGSTRADVTFQPKGGKPEFTIDIQIENTNLTSMNDLLRAYGSFDVVGGTFSLYSELAAHNGKVDGYIKPLLKDLNIYDRKQEKGESVLGKIGEGFMAAFAWALQNKPEDQVGTKVPISGNLDDPEVSTLQTVFNLLSNAFIQAIAPGLEEEKSKKG